MAELRWNTPVLQERMKRLWRDPNFFVKTLLPLDPHAGQETWLTKAVEPINILVPGNRFGKSTVIAMRHIWHCFGKVGAVPGPKETWMTMPYETISIAHSADQAEIVFNMAKRMLSHPAIKPFVKRIYSTPFPRIVFYNGAVMHCRSAHDGGKYIDGHAYRFISIDEAGYIDNLKELMSSVIIMRLAGGGMIDLIGTPKGYGDLFWYANRGLRGVKGYYTQRGSIYDNPHLSKDDIRMRDELLKHADPRLREQVIYGEFVSLTGMAFTKDQMDNAFVEGMPAHQNYIPGHRYVQAWDLGRRTDYTVGITLDVTRTPWQLVDFVRLNKVPWETIYELIEAKSQEYHVYQPIIDATGPQGDVIEEELRKRGTWVHGVKTSTLALKTELINTLQAALDHDRETVGERDWIDEAMVVHKVPDLEPPRTDPWSFEPCAHTEAGWPRDGHGMPLDEDSAEGRRFIERLQQIKCFPENARRPHFWGWLRMPAITQLVDEMGTYQFDDKDLVQDCVFALALATQARYTLLYDPLPGLRTGR